MILFSVDSNKRSVETGNDWRKTEFKYKFNVENEINDC